MSLQSKYASVVARELRHHAVWEPGEPVRLGDYGTFSRGRFSVHGNIRDDFEIAFDVVRSRNREFAFRSDGVSESRSESKAKQPGAVAELRVGFRSADALYVSSPSAWTEQIKGLARAVRPLIGNPQWRPEWMVVTRLYHASPAIILLSNSDDADVCLNLGADGVALTGDAGNDVGEQGSVALQLTGVRGPLFMGLHRVHKDLEDVVPRRRLVNRVLVLAGAGLVASGALTSWLVISGLRHPNDAKEHVATHAPKEASERKELRIDEAVDTSDAGTSTGVSLGSLGHGGGSAGVAAPGSVRMRFEANVPAEIRDRSGNLLGTSDAQVALPDEGPMVVAILAEGHKGRAVEVVPRANGVVAVALAEAKTQGPANGGGVYMPTGKRCTSDEDCGEGDICAGLRCVEAAVPAEVVVEASAPSEVDPPKVVASETNGDVAAAEETAEGPAPALLWLTLGLSALGLGLVIAWLRRRFAAPLEPVRPSDVDDPS
ncbi:MAG: hypothetical protein R3A79_17830 [Nannocystaceae bacterium]